MAMIRGFQEDEARNDFGRRMSDFAKKEARHRSLLKKWLLDWYEEQEEKQEEENSTIQQEENDNLSKGDEGVVSKQEKQQEENDRITTIAGKKVRKEDFVASSLVPARKMNPSLAARKVSLLNVRQIYAAY